ncbi:uncharacterized protein C8R40DRAFT_619366 [Lentinula edodes]|uniref:uncharacterized protein n=1 Tax=Lentinula edodes TaxID=5353 RepID=UPI001E8E1684|nr:uncharacterized protein C8R40DRAFT_619366 [Lentinula edodes]KAH7870963.1 hypothetical protein C8R40DRAFT_619366 [Lentinula edodes]
MLDFTTMNKSRISSTTYPQIPLAQAFPCSLNICLYAISSAGLEFRRIEQLICLVLSPSIPIFYILQPAGAVLICWRLVAFPILLSIMESTHFLVRFFLHLSCHGVIIDTVFQSQHTPMISTTLRPAFIYKLLFSDHVLTFTCTAHARLHLVEVS